MDAEREKYLRIYRDYFNTNMACPYCSEPGSEYGIHEDTCFMLDIVAYIEENVPLPPEAAAQQPPSPLPADTVADGGAGLSDVQCSCGYMASQHWADGSCPGDGYAYHDAPENHVNDPEMPYSRFMDILRKELHFPPDDGFGEWAVIEAIRQDRAIIMTDESTKATLQAENARLRAALALYGKAIDILFSGMDFDPDREEAYAVEVRSGNFIIMVDNNDGDYDILEKVVADRKAQQAADGSGG